MGKIIKMIPIGEDCLFVYGYNSENEIVFRSSKNISLLQTERPVIDKNMVYLNLYYFPIEDIKGIELIKDDE